MVSNGKLSVCEIDNLDWTAVTQPIITKTTVFYFSKQNPRKNCSINFISVKKKSMDRLFKRSLI